MGAQLNIKDAETIELARNLAAKLGKSVTATIRDALEEKARTREADIQARIAAIHQIVDDARKKLPPELKGVSSKELMDSIYDEYGLPE